MGFARAQPILRAVTSAELESIQSLGAFVNPAGIETKYFSTTLQGAQSYAAQAASRFGEGPFTMVQTSIPSNLVSTEMRATVDRGIPTVTIPSETLPMLSPPQVLPP